MKSHAHENQLEAHAVDIERHDVEEYFWYCSCGRCGDTTRSARRARNGGLRHVAAMERGR